MNPIRHAGSMVSTLAGNASLVVAITRVELQKRFAGSVLGVSWLFLQPALLLSVYLFVYLVVFKVRFPGFSELDYVVFVFAGLVPFLGAIEALNGSVLSIKANMHLVKNVMLPIELVPVRTVMVALSGEAVGLALVILLSAINGSLGPTLALLPVAVLLQVIALLGLAWLVSGLGVALPDVSNFVSLFMFLLMFISPIAFKPDMVPSSFQVVVYANPVFYMVEMFRDCLISGREIDPRMWGANAVLSMIVFVLGAAFFRAFKSILADYE